MPDSLTAIFSLVGVLLGGLISLLVAMLVARQTLKGQRILARDDAFRDYRKQQIEPYLQAARRRFRIWSAIYAEVGVGDKAKWLELQAQLTDPDFNSLIVTFVEVPDDTFMTAFNKFVAAEGKLRPTPTDTTDYTTEEIMDRIVQMRLILLELSTASQRYIFSAESGS
jgi:gas vesicle protein